MQSFNLFVVVAVLLINTQFISAKSFVCPSGNGKPNQTHEEEIEKVNGRFTCDKVDLKGSDAMDSFCCDVAGEIGKVEPTSK
ncbi:hypothetical protein KEM48_006067 [Puccinia striiformis f. sp. tritici PST-130]|nr:hypothetical protein H4Q26_006099 [Puccinia striiformis f. sp. tritici PST-130]KAI9614178.1 hypothetical protein KEM48_006067 [Puccinia striiformis f. sp. tritici PST-130]